MKGIQPFGLARAAKSHRLVMWEINNDKSVDSSSFAIAQKLFLSKRILSDRLAVSHQHNWDGQTPGAGRFHYLQYSGDPNAIVESYGVDALVEGTISHWIFEGNPNLNDVCICVLVSGHEG